MVEPHFSLYFHIPFCSRKCDYCHFYVLPDRQPDQLLLMQGFKREWELWLPQLKGKKLLSIYFGGGTPALLGPERIAEILGWVREVFRDPCEVTLEANPEMITPTLMEGFSGAGVDRISIGIQTLDDGLLARLGRTHSARQAREAVVATYAAGISNISVDLMYDIPYQTLLQWQQTLQELQRLPITHLSLYNLTIEPNTLYFKKRRALLPTLPDPEASLQMYTTARQSLAEMGLSQYEISAFAKPGFESRHNVGYWTARPFLGFGPSAFSYWEGRRFRNVVHLKRYCHDLEEGRSPVDFSEELDPAAKRRELLAIQLRLCEGVDLKEFQARHGLLDDATKRTLAKLQEKGFLEQTPDRTKLTSKGMLFYDSVAVELI